MPVKGFPALERATKKAFDNLKATSQEAASPNADVELYETLSPEAFDVIASTYGPDNLIQYVQAMEVRRMKGLRHAR